jgi:hypothetical protein
MPPRFDIRYDTSDLDRHPLATSMDEDPLIQALNAHPSFRDYLSDLDPTPEEYDRLVASSRDYLSDPDPTPEEYDRLVASASAVYHPVLRDFLAEWD